MELVIFSAIGWATALASRLIVWNSRLGLITRLLIGMVGGVFGGTLGGTFNQEQPLFEIAPPSLTGALLGALVTLFVVPLLDRQRVYG
ncbi:MAG TPA: hypothetical protein VF815_10340 [Myxococcaceae bacterium]|jgi:uncharacterized membrane protein YeaQ/YmgE (transglycosylase-associated protein family)